MKPCAITKSERRFLAAAKRIRSGKDKIVTITAPPQSVRDAIADAMIAISGKSLPSGRTTERPAPVSQGNSARLSTRPAGAGRIFEGVK